MRGVISALLAEKEGARVFFRGTKSTILRDAPYSGIYFAIYNDLKREHKYDPSQSQSTQPLKHDPEWWQTAWYALVASTGATLLTQPFDFFRLRLQTRKASDLKEGTWSYLNNIMKEEGRRVVFRGCTLRIARRSLQAALTWTLFEHAS